MIWYIFCNIFPGARDDDIQINFFFKTSSTIICSDLSHTLFFLGFFQGFLAVSHTYSSSFMSSAFIFHYPLLILFYPLSVSSSPLVPLLSFIPLPFYHFLPFVSCFLTSSFIAHYSLIMILSPITPFFSSHLYYPFLSLLISRFHRLSVKSSFFLFNNKPSLSFYFCT